MKRFQIKSKAGRYTWLQLLTLAISGVAYVMQSMLVFVIMLLLATLFGILAMMLRLQEAKQMARQQPVRGRRRP